jgi:hypothetical protein
MVNLIVCDVPAFQTSFKKKSLMKLSEKEIIITYTSGRSVDSDARICDVLSRDKGNGQSKERGNSSKLHDVIKKSDKK